MLAINLLLAISWLLLTGEFTPGNFATGFILGYLMLLLANKATPENTAMTRYLRRIPDTIKFSFYFIWTIVIANFRMALAVVSPLDRLNPAIVEVPLDIKGDLAITLLANWITLTPGTLTIEVADDKSSMFVHTYHCTDVEAFRTEMKESFEQRIRELTDDIE